MTASLPTPAAPAVPSPSLRLVVVPTPQPPLQDERIPVRLVRPGVPVPRPVHRPGPRILPVTGPELDDDFGPKWSTRNELPDPGLAGRRLFTLALEAMAGR